MKLATGITVTQAFENIRTAFSGVFAPLLIDRARKRDDARHWFGLVAGDETADLVMNITMSDKCLKAIMQSFARGEVAGEELLIIAEEMPDLCNRMTDIRNSRAIDAASGLSDLEIAWLLGQAGKTFEPMPIDMLRAFLRTYAARKNGRNSDAGEPR